MKDDQDFMPTIVEQIFKHASAKLRDCDSDATLFGDNFNAETTPDDVVKVALNYVDALAVQFGLDYFDNTCLPRLHEKHPGVPIVVADMGFAFPLETKYDKYMWPLFENQEAAAKAYQNLVTLAAKSGYVVSISKCGYIDRVVTQPYTILKPGLFNQAGIMHEPIAHLLKEANEAAQLEHQKHQSQR